MGCDIHFTLFARQKSDNKKIDLLYKDYHREKVSEYEVKFFEDNENCFSEYKSLFEDFIEGRSYFLFGIISGVRSNEYYFDTNSRTFLNGAPKGFEDMDLESTHSYTLFKANGLRSHLKKIIKKIVANEIQFSDNKINEIKSSNDEEDIDDEETDYFEDDIQTGFSRICLVENLITKLDDYQNTIKKNLPDIDSDSLELFFWYDS